MKTYRTHLRNAANVGKNSKPLQFGIKCFATDIRCINAANMRVTGHGSMRVFRWIFVTGLWLSALQPGVSGICSDLLSDVEIYADWWSVLPYSTRLQEKNGNYTFNGELHFVLNVVKRISISHQII